MRRSSQATITPASMVWSILILSRACFIALCWQAMGLLIAHAGRMQQRIVDPKGRLSVPGMLSQNVQHRPGLTHLFPRVSDRQQHDTFAGSDMAGLGEPAIQGEDGGGSRRPERAGMPKVSGIGARAVTTPRLCARPAPAVPCRQLGVRRVGEAGPRFHLRRP